MSLPYCKAEKNQFEKSLQDLYEKLIDGTIDKETYLSQKASKRIEVHSSTVDENGVKHVPVDIHFTAVGIINIPDAEEILQIMEEIRTKPLRIA